MNEELKPIFQNGRQIGPCGLCGRAGEAWQRRIVGGEQIITLHYCPILKDDVNTFYGGCWKFISKTQKQVKTNIAKKYYNSVLEMRNGEAK